MAILIRCSWCKKNMGSKPIDDWDSERLIISHSICPSCYEQVSEQIKKNRTSNGSTSHR